MRTSRYLLGCETPQNIGLAERLDLRPDESLAPALRANNNCNELH